MTVDIQKQFHHSHVCFFNRQTNLYLQFKHYDFESVFYYFSIGRRVNMYFLLPDTSLIYMYITLTINPYRFQWIRFHQFCFTIQACQKPISCVLLSFLNSYFIYLDKIILPCNVYAKCIYSSFTFVLRMVNELQVFCCNDNTVNVIYLPRVFSHVDILKVTDLQPRHKPLWYSSSQGKCRQIKVSLFFHYNNDNSIKSTVIDEFAC